jgi:hypothetical protein
MMRLIPHVEQIRSRADFEPHRPRTPIDHFAAERDASPQAGPASEHLAVGAAASRRHGTAASAADVIASRYFLFKSIDDLDLSRLDL